MKKIVINWEDYKEGAQIGCLCKSCVAFKNTKYEYGVLEKYTILFKKIVTNWNTDYFGCEIVNTKEVTAINTNINGKRRHIYMYPGINQAQREIEASLNDEFVINGDLKDEIKTVLVSGYKLVPAHMMPGKHTLLPTVRQIRCL